MINRLALSIVKKQVPVFSAYINLAGLKICHLFSNKKDPFDKFKRNANKGKTEVKNDNKEEKKPEQQTQKTQTTNQNVSQNHKFQSQQNKSQPTGKTIPGFNKFKRDTKFQQKLNINKKKQPESIWKSKKQQPKAQQQENINKMQKQQQSKSAQEQDKKSHKKISIAKNKPVNKMNDIKTQNMKLKGFQKFKKVELDSKDKLNQKAEESSDNKKEQSQLNSKSEQENMRQQAYKNTDKKIEEGKQDWEKFMNDQIKRQKDKAKKAQGNNWKGFNFTMGGGNKDKQGQQNQEQKKSFFRMPKTPFQTMRAIFFGGIAMYLGTVLLAQIYLYDSSKQIQTTQMLNLLNQGKLAQTWSFTTVESLSEESSRTKKYICSLLTTGQMVKSQSNDQFESQWIRLVDSYNVNAGLMGMGVPPVIKKAPIVKKDSHIFNSIRSMLSFGLLFMFLKSMMGGLSKGKGQMGKGGGLSGLFQNTKSHRFRQNINVKFDDVVGMNKAKQQIVQFIDFLKNAQKYNKLGAKIPRGALLTGPPGTGKTMLAKACAGQSGVPFFTISGSQFMQMYVGVGAQRVRNLFTQAKESAPSIIFIDQIDAVGKKRASGVGGGGNDERDNTLNQLLVEMDGFDQTTNVIVFAATNQKQVLDPALTRPGRFDRLIQVDLPDIQGRKQIFLVHLKPITLDQRFPIEQYAKRLATLTPGFSGADIKNFCNQAAIIAARNDKKCVSMIDFELASERIIGGVQKKSSLITPQTKRTVAYHECGHGVVSWFMEHASPLLKLTIIPRSKGALGYAQYLPNQNQVYTRKQLQDQICVILGGRISEQIFFKKISTGASDDLQKAHKVAKAIIAEYGMGKKLGWLSYSQTQYAKQYSHETEQKIDDQILQIIYQCSVRTRQIIQQKKDMIQKLAQLLLKQQTIDQRMIQGILGQRPFKSSKQYEQYIRQKKKLQEQQQKQLEQPPLAGGAAAPFKSLDLLNQLKNQIQPKSQKINIL